MMFVLKRMTELKLWYTEVICWNECVTKPHTSELTMGLYIATYIVLSPVCFIFIYELHELHPKWKENSYLNSG